MKEVKLLDRVQVVLTFYIIIILATIQENSLISVLACNNGFHISLQFDIDVFMKSVMLKPLSCITYNLL